MTSGKQSGAHFSPRRHHALQDSLELLLVTEVIASTVNELHRLLQLYKRVIP